MHAHKHAHKYYQFHLLSIHIIILSQPMTAQHEITQPQYESILKYMEATNEDDYTQALQMMKAHQFVLENAVSTKLGLNDPQHLQPERMEHQENQENMQAARQANNQEEIRKYIQYLRQRQKRPLISGIFNYGKKLFVSIFRGLTELIVPEFILKKVFRSRFYNMYSKKVLPEFRDRNLTYHLDNSFLSRKPILFIISLGDGHDCLIDLLNNPQIAKKISQSFILSGSMSDEKQCTQIEGEKQPPTIIICRKNIFEKVEVVKRFVGETAIREITVDKLNYALRDHQRAARKDRNLLVKYRNYIRANYYGGRPGYYEEEEEVEELFYPERQAVRSDMIKQQNEEYKKVEEQTRRKQSMRLAQKQKQLEEFRKNSELQQERKIRKMSIPDEPSEGQIIRFNFRCPDGSTKTRNFDSNQKLDLIYHWVETNEQIQFEDNAKRHFELLHGFPPSSLGERKEKKLKDVFDSDQEKIMIRQL